jgi:hypothetical protein
MVPHAAIQQRTTMRFLNNVQWYSQKDVGAITAESNGAHTHCQAMAIGGRQGSAGYYDTLYLDHSCQVHRVR